MSFRTFWTTRAWPFIKGHLRILIPVIGILFLILFLLGKGCSGSASASGGGFGLGVFLAGVLLLWWGVRDSTNRIPILIVSGLVLLGLWVLPKVLAFLGVDLSVLGGFFFTVNGVFLALAVLIFWWGHKKGWGFLWWKSLLLLAVIAMMVGGNGTVLKSRWEAFWNGAGVNPSEVVEDVVDGAKGLVPAEIRKSAGKHVDATKDRFDQSGDREQAKALRDRIRTIRFQVEERQFWISSKTPIFELNFSKKDDYEIGENEFIPVRILPGMPTVVNRKGGQLILVVIPKAKSETADWNFTEGEEVYVDAARLLDSPPPTPSPKPAVAVTPVPDAPPKPAAAPKPAILKLAFAKTEDVYAMPVWVAAVPPGKWEVTSFSVKLPAGSVGVRGSFKPTSGGSNFLEVGKIKAGLVFQGPGTLEIYPAEPGQGGRGYKRSHGLLSKIGLRIRKEAS